MKLFTAAVALGGAFWQATARAVTNDTPPQFVAEVVEDRRPVRGKNNPFDKLNKEWDKKTGRKDDEDNATHTVASSACYLTSRANSNSKKGAECPAECPFYAQDRADTEHCTFACVTAEDCKQWNPNKPIADETLGACRGPMVQFCEEYVMDGETVDECRICAGGYSLGKDGQCHYELMWVIYIVAGIVGLVVVVALAWIIDMILRPAINQKGLDQAMAHRQRNLLHKRDDSAPLWSPRSLSRQATTEEASEGLWPLRTNMCTTDVAGAGILLHMNFQAVVIGWAILVAAGWALLAVLIDTDLFILGTRKFGTPRENCILVAWGYETQQELLWVKRLFLWIVYVGSFALAMLHGVRQLRLYQRLDRDQKSMKDFVAILHGLPPLAGSRRVEEELKTAIESAAGTTIVGVSIAWAFKEDKDRVMEELATGIEQMQEDLEGEETSGPSSPRAQPSNFLRAKIDSLEDKMFGDDGEEEEEQEKCSTKELLEGMTTTTDAFVVFQTEAARDDIVAKFNDQGGLAFEGATLTFEDAECEPGTVTWSNFGYSSDREKFLRALQGVGMILLALLFWVTVFYGPYAWSISNFNYDNGQEPGMIYSMSFTIIVCVGNVIMYEVCNRVAEHIGFRFTDDKEAAYMIFYTVACSFNVMVDMITTYIMAYAIMSELGFRTYFGTRLSEVPIFPDAFETYAIQRSLAENTYMYAFPSTFLIPFLIEPIATIFAPLYLGKVLVRTHKMKAADAEEWVASAPLELGRYSDLLLNVVLGILIFYFPGGYTSGLFVAMAISHVYIYCFDHWRILRAIPKCTFASMKIDWFAQMMLAPCIGLILACLVFKSNTEADQPSLGPFLTVIACTTAFVVHCAVHLMLLIYVVPRFGESESSGDKHDEVTFPDLARIQACNWFNSNPVHCLRSKEIYKHSPPCVFLMNGKEHLLRVNQDIGCYYKTAQPVATTAVEEKA
eukprot:TRINITY_DN299_c0_g1_i3.p1 TRINITY_DN299_c0_g1~~TRINITY_DN299_c0_g1_i3.p1  ORF type:complete len:956 (-),score=264.29 TRINITY_DN299_c0_g1_i3:261-3128(-)